MSIVWGIDCGSARIGFGVADTDAEVIDTRAVAWRVPDPRKVLQLSNSLRQCEDALLAFFEARANVQAPDSIAYERPSGTHANPSLMMHTGVIVLAAAKATGRAPWAFAGAPEWKKVIGLPGNCNKAKVNAWCLERGMDLEIARDIDRTDAAAIAAAAAFKWDGCAPEDVRVR
jgi:Holliday junction resolvasome RuvABC endonuclease subunit